MNVYEININEMFLWVASETSFDAIYCAMEKRDGYQDEEQNSIVSKMIPENQWDTVTFHDCRDGAPEGTKITLKEVMSTYIEIKEATIVAAESDD